MQLENSLLPSSCKPTDWLGAYQLLLPLPHLLLPLLSSLLLIRGPHCNTFQNARQLCTPVTWRCYWEQRARVAEDASGMGREARRGRTTAQMVSVSGVGVGLKFL